MSKSHYAYPPDEFDARGPEGAPVGVHREPRSGWSAVWPFLLVAVVFAGLAVGIVSYLSDDKTPGSASAPTAAATQDGGGADGSAEGGSEEGSAEGGSDEGVEGEPQDGEEPSEEPSEATMPGDPAAANLAAEIVVFNDGAGPGQAGNATSVLESAGFTTVLAADASDAPVALAGAYADSTVLYGTDRADTASAVAEALGVPAANVQESQDVANHPTNAVWVVLKTPVG